MPDRKESNDRWHEHIRSRLASLGLAPEREAEIIEELSQHLEERYHELLHDGATEEHARRLALDELLDASALANEMRPLRQARAVPVALPRVRVSLVADLRQDLRHAVRGWRKQRIFAAAALVTLALGIGGTTAIFGIVNSVLIRPLPYQQPDELVRIVHVIGGIRQPYFSDAIYQSYVEHSQTLAQIGVWRPDATAIITGQGDPEEVRALNASRSVLTILGVAPELGRWFSAAEDTPGAPGVVMLTHGYWQRKFGGDPNVLSRSLTIDGRPNQIVGVMPASFRFGGEHDMIRPLRVNPTAPVPVFRLLGVARLKPGVTLEQANADVVRVLQPWFENTNTPPDVRARWVPALQPLKADVIGDISATLWVIMSAIAIVLVMACANVANLLLVRAEGRRRELAIRSALGATWPRIARQLLVETLMLAFFGGAVGVTLAYGAVRALPVLAPPTVPRLNEISIDPTVLAFAAAISLASGLLFAVIPVVKYARPKMGALGVSVTAASRERQRAQQLLVTAQVALALVLLVSAGLMIRSFQALLTVDPGFTSPDTLQTFTLSITPSVAQEPERATRLQHDLIEKIEAIPGVSSAAFATRMPMGVDRTSTALTIKGRADDGRTPPNHQAKIISPGLFRVQGTPMLAGRDFTWMDVLGTQDLAIVSKSLAREFWGSPQAAIGQMIREYYDARAPWREVIGVAGDVHDDGVNRDAPTTIYFPARPVQRAFGVPGVLARRVTIAIRTPRAGTEELMEQVRSAVRSINGSIPLADVRTLGDAYRRSMARTSFTLVLLGVAAAAALLLGMCGIYGVISYAVSQRRREIGIRLTLGASVVGVRRLFVRRGLRMGVVGLLVGLSAAFVLTRLMKSVLFGVTPLDPVTFAAMPLLLAAAAVLASYLPARAASMVDPVETMRVE